MFGYMLINNISIALESIIHFICYVATLALSILFPFQYKAGVVAAF
jgi:hypothetical protein